MKIPALFWDSRKVVRPAARKLARAIFESGDWDGCLCALPHLDTDVTPIECEMKPGMGDMYGAKETCKPYLFQDAWQKVMQSKLDVFKEPDRTVWYLRRRDGRLEGVKQAWYCAVELEYPAGLPGHHLQQVEWKTVCRRLGETVLMHWDELERARRERGWPLYASQLYEVLRQLGCPPEQVGELWRLKAAEFKKVLTEALDRVAGMPEYHVELEGAGWPKG